VSPQREVLTLRSFFLPTTCLLLLSDSGKVQDLPAPSFSAERTGLEHLQYLSASASRTETTRIAKRFASMGSLEPLQKYNFTGGSETLPTLLKADRTHTFGAHYGLSVSNKLPFYSLGRPCTDTLRGSCRVGSKVLGYHLFICFLILFE
jgi:hypothetical protein